MTESIGSISAHTSFDGGATLDDAPVMIWQRTFVEMIMNRFSLPRLMFATNRLADSRERGQASVRELLSKMANMPEVVSTPHDGHVSPDHDLAARGTQRFEAFLGLKSQRSRALEFMELADGEGTSPLQACARASGGVRAGRTRHADTDLPRRYESEKAGRHGAHSSPRSRGRGHSSWPA